MKKLVLLCLMSTVPASAAPFINVPSDREPIDLVAAHIEAEIDSVIQLPTAEERAKTVRELQQLRFAHLQARDDFAKALRRLHETYKDHTNHGFAGNLPQAIGYANALVENCIKLKESFVFPHNIALLIAPETIRTECYQAQAPLVRALSY